MNKQLDIDFSDAHFESDEEPKYSKGFMKKMKDEMQHQRKLDQGKFYRKERPSSAQVAKPKQLLSPAPQNNKGLQTRKITVAQKIIKTKVQSATTQPKPTPPTKNVKFHPKYFSETVPTIQVHSQYEASDVQASDAPQKKPPTQKIIRNIPKQKSEVDRLKELGLLDWEEDEDLDDRFIIKNLPKQYGPTPSESRLTEAERKNRRDFLKKFKSPQKEDLNSILKQQESEISQKKSNLQQQMGIKDILQNNLVISKVPEILESDTKKQADDLDEYENEKFEEDNLNEEQDLHPQEKRIEQQQQQIQQKQPAQQIKQAQSRPSLLNKQLANPDKNSKKPMYRPRTAKERKQEIEAMKAEMEKHLLQNNEHVARLFRQFKESQEKESTMVEISQKRQEQLQSAQQTLHQLREKCDQQQAIIEELTKKEHYASQIIDVLKANKVRFEQDYRHEIQKMLACKIILRFLRFRKDRRMFEDFKKAKFMQKLKE